MFRTRMCGQTLLFIVIANGAIVAIWVEKLTATVHWAYPSAKSSHYLICSLSHRATCTHTHTEMRRHITIYTYDRQAYYSHDNLVLCLHFRLYRSKHSLFIYLPFLHSWCNICNLLLTVVGLAFIIKQNLTRTERRQECTKIMHTTCKRTPTLS